jgi:hypothetical protein
MKWLALTTPQEHLLHHTVDLQGNYGNFTVVWDRLFGTYLDPMRSEYQDRPLGLAYDQDFVGTLTAGRLKLPGSLRARFEVDRFCNLDERGTATDERGTAAHAEARRTAGGAETTFLEQHQHPRLGGSP